MMDVSGLQFAYSFLCLKKLWYYSKQITMEQNNEDVQLGSIIDNKAFKDKQKHILIDNTVNVDFINDGVIYEIKKSNAEKEMTLWQIKFYLYYLKKKGVEQPKGILKIPTERY